MRARLRARVRAYVCIRTCKGTRRKGFHKWNAAHDNASLVTAESDRNFDFSEIILSFCESRDVLY